MIAISTKSSSFPVCSSIPSVRAQIHTLAIHRLCRLLCAFKPNQLIDANVFLGCGCCRCAAATTTAVRKKHERNRVARIERERAREWKKNEEENVFWRKKYILRVRWLYFFFQQGFLCCVHRVLARHTRYICMMLACVRLFLFAVGRRNGGTYTIIYRLVCVLEHVLFFCRITLMVERCKDI